MDRLALTLRDVAAAAPDRDDSGWELAAEADDEAAESWVFEAICLQHGTTDARTPHRVTVRIEPELLGFVVEERAFWPPDQPARVRRVFIGTETDAVTEAGRIAHDWLCRGYAVFLGESESPAA